MNQTETGSTVGGKSVVEETYRNHLPSALISRLSQSEAAMLAVFAAHKREDMDERRRHEASALPSLAEQALYDWLLELEAVAVQSIQKNDGNVVYWIGHAAKQINPLLS